jgi:transposase-like protein
MATPDRPNHFLLEELFPQAFETLHSRIRGLEEILADCDIVLDTNVLLLPFGSGTTSLAAITAVYKSLSDKGRIFLPERVIREYASNRVAKLAEVYKNLADHQSKILTPRMPEFPLLEGSIEYNAARTLEAAMIDAAKRFKEGLASLLGIARQWGLNDPVSKAYREIFNEKAIWKVTTSQQDIVAQLEHRFSNKIPPGYKDAKKDDAGVGDLVIWLTILEIARSRKRDIIFVSGDEKADWQHRVDNRGFLPRSELIDEFRRHSSGRSFHIVQLSTLLELFKVDASVVEEVQNEEARERELMVAEVPCPLCEVLTSVAVSRRVGSSASPVCVACGRRFHAHQTAEGIVAKAPNWRSTQGATRLAEHVSCPYCGHETQCLLGAAPGESAQPTCAECDRRFHVHRIRSGVVRVNGAYAAGATPSVATDDE